MAARPCDTAVEPMDAGYYTSSRNRGDQHIYGAHRAVPGLEAGLVLVILPGCNGPDGNVGKRLDEMGVPTRAPKLRQSDSRLVDLQLSERSCNGRHPVLRRTRGDAHRKNECLALAPVGSVCRFCTHRAGRTDPHVLGRPLLERCDRSLCGGARLAGPLPDGYPYILGVSRPRDKERNAYVTTSRLLAGASGYSFKEWKGSFYPEKMKPEEMLSFYAERLPTVEINNTFYRMPKVSVLESWAGSTPEGFRFAIKASRRITHMARIKAESAEPLAFLYRNLASLGAKRGAVLFQLPPNLKKDLPRLTEFLSLLPEEHGAAFEFRNDTWFADDVYDALKSAGAALCLSEREDNAPPPLVETAPWGYVRLRLETYSDDDLRQWASKLEATSWREIYVYFMHEPTARADADAVRVFVETGAQSPVGCRFRHPSFDK